MSQDKQLLDALTALKNGDFSVRLPTDQDGAAKEIAETFNATMEQLNHFSSEVLRIMREIGPEGRFGGQAEVPNLSGTWEEIREAVNVVGVMLTNQVRDLGNITRTMLNGQPGYAASAPAQGETAQLQSQFNQLIEQFGALKEKV